MPSLRAKRGKPFYQRPFLVTRTVLRSTVIQTVAEVLVASGLEAARCDCMHSFSVWSCLARCTWDITASLAMYAGYTCQSTSPKRKGGRSWHIGWPSSRCAALCAWSQGLQVGRLPRATCVVCFHLGNSVLRFHSLTAAGVVGTVRPGVACLLASVAAGFAADVYVCIPAIQEYESRRRLSTQTCLILAGSIGVVTLCFLPWIVPSYFTNAGYTADSRLALS